MSPCWGVETQTLSPLQTPSQRPLVRATHSPAGTTQRGLSGCVSAGLCACRCVCVSVSARRPCVPACFYCFKCVHGKGLFHYVCPSVTPLCRRRTEQKKRTRSVNAHSGFQTAHLPWKRSCIQLLAKGKYCLCNKRNQKHLLCIFLVSHVALGPSPPPHLIALKDVLSFRKETLIKLGRRAIKWLRIHK